jgi:hemoglobin
MNTSLRLLTLLALTASLGLIGCKKEAKPAAEAAAVAGPSFVYEGVTYSFPDEAARAAFQAKVEGSLYHRLGGKAAIDAAVEKFYVRVLADDRIKHFFTDINMNAQRRKQKEFLSAAFGSPVAWKGKDMAKAHANLDITEAHFNAVAEDLQKTLEEMKVPKNLIDEVMAIAASTKSAIVRKPAAK